MMRFCGKCGTELQRGCMSCGFDNPAGFVFCGRCGQSLDEMAANVAAAAMSATDRPSSVGSGLGDRAVGNAAAIASRGGAVGSGESNMASSGAQPTKRGSEAAYFVSATPADTPSTAASSGPVPSAAAPHNVTLASLSHSAIDVRSDAPSRNQKVAGVRYDGRGADYGKAAASRRALAAADTGVREGGNKLHSNAVRRQTTVMFCDLVGSTELSERLDPEELRDVIRAYQTVVASAVERYDGHVAQYLGDGLLVYFGYPRAHEDDARRAVTAGLDIVEAVSDLAGPGAFDGSVATLAVRIGIHTGPVVGGEMGAGRKSEQLVIGQVPNVAARLQQLAGQNEVMVSEATAKLVRGFFELDAVGAKTLRGLSSPLNVYGVGGRSGVSERFDLEVRRGLGALFGRRDELGTLQGCFDAAVASPAAQSVLVVGEAGIGKSRLLHAFHNAHKKTTWRHCRCSPYAQASALYPLVELLTKLLKIRPDDSAARQRARIARVVADDDARALELLAIFLSVPDADPAKVPLTPQQQQQHTLQLLIQVIAREAQRGPLVFVIEDLHWADPSMLHFIDVWLTHVQNLPVLTLMSARMHFQEPWGHRPHHTLLALERLDDTAARQLVKAVTGGRPLPEPLLAELISKTDGVPLFVEELTKMLVESGALELRVNRYVLSGSFESIDIPATLRDSLTARLDALGPARDIAQVASAIGRRFSYSLLSAISTLDGLVLRARLEQLLAAELIYREANSRNETYAFKHALIRDCAYDSLLRKQRCKIHGNIADTIESRFAALTHARPDLLARHYEEAGRHEKAITYLLRAGERAATRSAHTEAAIHYLRAIKLLEAQRQGSEHDEVVELRVRIAAGGSIIATRGYAAAAVHENYARAYHLAQQLGLVDEEFPALYGLWVYHLACSRRDLTEEYAARLLEQVTRSPRRDNEISAYFARGTTALYRGRINQSLADFDAAIERYEPDDHVLLMRTYGDDHGLFSKVYRQWLLLMAGRLTEACAQKDETVALARSFDDPLAESLAMSFAMLFHHDLHEVKSARALALSTIQLATENGFPFWTALGRCGRGWTSLQQAVTLAAVQDIREGLAFFDLIEQKLPLTYWRSYLIEALCQTGEIDEGLQLVEETLAMARTNVDSIFEPELLRLKAMLLSFDEQPLDDVENAFALGIKVADDHGAHFFAFRVALDYGCWLKRHARQREVPALLTPRIAAIDGECPLLSRAHALVTASNL